MTRRETVRELKRWRTHRWCGKETCQPRPMFGSILVLASSVARAASKYHLLLRDPHFSVIAVLVSSTDDQGGTLKGRSRKTAHTFSEISYKSYCKGQRERISMQRTQVVSLRVYAYDVKRFRKESKYTFAYNHFIPRYYYILTAGQQVESRSRLGAFMSFFKNLSIRGEDPRLNFMK